MDMYVSYPNNQRLPLRYKQPSLSNENKYGEHRGFNQLSDVEIEYARSLDQYSGERGHPMYQEFPSDTVGLTVEGYMNQGAHQKNLPPNMQDFAFAVEESFHVGNEAYLPRRETGYIQGDRVRAVTAPEYPTKPRPGAVGPSGGKVRFYQGRFSGMPDITQRQQFLSQQVNKPKRDIRAKSFRDEHLDPTFLGDK